MTKMLLAALFAACTLVASAVSEAQSLWKKGDNGVAVYRIPALCTAPNGDLIAACDARTKNGGDLCVFQPINITIRTSSDNGKTWTEPKDSYTWPWNDSEQWSGSDPSFIVDRKAKKVFLFYNVWNWNEVAEHRRANGIYHFYVQESSDNGKTWSKPRDISQDIAIPGWPCGKPEREGGFIFITSGSGIQTSDGTLLHTIVHVGDGNALFGSPDHGKTWKPYGVPAKNGDECKVVELTDGSWMINSRWRGGGRQIHVSKDRGETWESYYDSNLRDPQCNAQIMRCGKVLLFSNCNAGGRSNVSLRASLDNGKTWTDGVVICPGPSAYSDCTKLKNGEIGVLYEAGPYNSIDFVTVKRDELGLGVAK